MGRQSRVILENGNWQQRPMGHRRRSLWDDRLTPKETYRSAVKYLLSFPVFSAVSSDHSLQWPIWFFKDRIRCKWTYANGLFWWRILFSNALFPMSNEIYLINDDLISGCCYKTLPFVHVIMAFIVIKYKSFNLLETSFSNYIYPDWYRVGTLTGIIAYLP